MSAVRRVGAVSLVGILAAVMVLSAGRSARHAVPAEMPPAGKEDRGVVIVDCPITFDDERRALTLDYIHTHYDPGAETIEIVPQMIVLHWPASCTWEGTWRTFNPVRINAASDYMAANGAVNLSSHFLVDRDGTIRRLMPETIMARHVIGLNHCAIGVENVGTDVGCTLTDAQVEANAALVRYLVAEYPTITYLIGHYKSESFRNTPLFTELVGGYMTPKIDPGAEFMARVGERVCDLGLCAHYDPGCSIGTPDKAGR